MNHYLVEAVYAPALPCTEEVLATSLIPAHAAHVQSGIIAGMVLCAGPKEAESGGFLVLRAQSREELDAFLDCDPLVTAGVQTFHVTPWNILDVQPALLPWLGR